MLNLIDTTYFCKRSHAPSKTGKVWEENMYQNFKKETVIVKKNESVHIF